MQEPLEVIVYPRQEIRKEFKQYLETLKGYLNVDALDPSVDLRLHKVLKNYLNDQCNSQGGHPLKWSEGNPAVGCYLALPHTRGWRR